MMMMSSISRSHAFTASQSKELELQMLIFNYVVSGSPIPPHLVLLFRRSLLLMDPFSVYPPVSFDRKVEEDPEPWRCRRTDGKKWRCSKEASQESKYCERHMHRGKKCSRKHVELPPAPAAAAATATPYPYSPAAYKYPPLRLSFDDDYHHGTAGFRRASGPKEDVQEHNFFSKESGRHCFVMGADLKLEKPAAAKEEGARKEEEKKPYLYLFDELVESKGSWMDSEEACAKTQLSISIP